MPASNKKLKHINYTPISYKVIKWLQQHKIPGSYRLEFIFRSRKFWDVSVKHSIKNGIHIHIPYIDNGDIYKDISNYESKSVNLVSNLAKQLSKPILLIDCGADIGLMSLRIISECQHITQLLAFEPNKNSFPFLEININELDIDAQVYNKAVSDYSGKAEMMTPSFDNHYHAAFIEPLASGSVEVTTIDALKINALNNLILKVDVEGEELPVIRGAANTLSKAKNFIVIFEAHKRQAERKNIDPISIISFISNIRPVRVLLTEDPEILIDISKPFFEQVPGDIYNICVLSTN